MAGKSRGVYREAGSFLDSPLCLALDLRMGSRVARRRPHWLPRLLAPPALAEGGLLDSVGSGRDSYVRSMREFNGFRWSRWRSSCCDHRLDAPPVARSLSADSLGRTPGTSRPFWRGESARHFTAALKSARSFQAGERGIDFRRDGESQGEGAVSFKEI